MSVANFDPSSGQSAGAAAANAEMYRAGSRAEEYQSSAYHTLRLKLLEEMLDQALAGRSKAGRILELGAGTQGFAKALEARGYDVVATDADSEVVATLRAQGLRAEVVDVDQPLPFEDASFAAVAMGELIEHIFDTRRLLENCRRVLMPRGVLAITTPNLATFQDRLAFLLGRAPRQVSPMHEYLSLHIRPFTFQSLRDALLESGFSDLRCRSNYVVWRTKGKARIRMRAPAKLFPTLGGSLVVTAHKA